jgi:hypothetical protein
VRSSVGGERVRAHGVDDDEKDVEERLERLAAQGRARIVKFAPRAASEGVDEVLLARTGLIHETEAGEPVWVLEGEVERQVARERRHRHVVVGFRPEVDEMAGEDASHDADGDVAAASSSDRLGGAPPEPAGQHRLDGQSHREVERDEGPGLRLQQRDGDQAQVIAVVGEEQAVEHEEAQHRGTEKDGYGQDEAWPGKEEDDGNEDQEREVGKDGHLADEGERRVDPARGWAEGQVVPEIARADESEETEVEESEPASPAQEPAAHRHYVMP